MSRSNEYCCVPGCKSMRSKHPGISFHHFPKAGTRTIKILNHFQEEEKVDARKAWVLKLKIGKEVTKNMVVCSRHFNENDFFFPGIACRRKRLKNDVVPSQNLPKLQSRGSFTFSPTKAQNKAAARLSHLAKRTLLHKEALENHLHDEDSNYDADVMNAAEVLIQLHSDHDTSTLNTPVDSSSSLSSNKSTCDKGIQVKSGDIIIPFITVMNSEDSLNTCTGLPSFEMLDSICQYMERVTLDQRTHKLSIKERVILTLMKLKQNMSFKILSILFQVITPNTCKRIFMDTIISLAAILQHLVQRWPDVSEIKRSTPKCFQDFEGVTGVLDCTDIAVQTPKCASCRLKFYSHYKSGFTIKFMTAVTPAGLICCVSEAYGGRASDKAICEQSHVLDHFQKEERVMVDKGFLIEDLCDKRGVKLVRPWYLRNKKQFSQKEALENRKISSARVHIERSNQRLKMFNILAGKYPISLIHVVNEVFIVICGITNLCSSILNDDKFLSSLT